MDDETGQHPARLKVGIIGPGRVGTALGVALTRAGHEVVAVAAVSDTSVQRAREHFPEAPLAEPAGVVEAADLVLLTVPDDALPGLVNGLVTLGAPVQGRLLAHTSGRYGISVLDPATRQGALPLALHPVMTFTGRSDDLQRLRGISFGITTLEQLRPVAEGLVIEMDGEPVFIAEEHRDLYHAALASAANHLVTLVTEACDLLQAAGAGNPARMLSPLLYAALDNALRLGDAGLNRAGGPGGPRRRRYRGRAPGRPARHRARGPGRVRGAGPADRRPRPGGRPACPARRRTAARRAGRSGPVTGLREPGLGGVSGTSSAPARPAVATTRAGLAAMRPGLGAPVVLVP